MAPIFLEAPKLWVRRSRFFLFRKWPPYFWKPLACGYVAAGAFFFSTKKGPIFLEALLSPKSPAFGGLRNSNRNSNSLTQPGTMTMAYLALLLLPPSSLILIFKPAVPLDPLQQVMQTRSTRNDPGTLYPLAEDMSKIWDQIPENIFHPCTH